jgi:hypothetical protein
MISNRNIASALMKKKVKDISKSIACEVANRIYFEFLLVNIFLKFW